MLGKIRQIWAPSLRRRRRAIGELRRQFAECGYSFDDLTDSQLEEAITSGRGGIEKIQPLTPKSIYWTLRRLSPDGEALQMRKIKGARRTQFAGGR